MTPINIYAIVAPAVLLLTLAEFIYCIKKKNHYYSFQDSIIGLGTAIIAQCVNVAIAVAIVRSYGWIYDHFAVAHIQPTWYNYILCYIGVDFLFYWFHRAGHRINVLWAAHVPHHTAEELNYAVALRSSFTQRAASFLFYWPLAVIGFAPSLILPTVALNLVFQLIPHTRVIPKLPSWIDSWLNTPYHHQVHHAANEIYWDRNYGGTFIVWDKWFGTYREQTEAPFYGVTIHPKSWDPTYLNLHWFVVLWNDMMAAEHFSDKIKIWFMPPGWRPRGMLPYEKNPTKNEATQIKYRTQAIPGSTPYLLTQLCTSMGIMMFVISNHSPLSGMEKVWVSAILWLGITVWGGILESKKWAVKAEILKIVLTGSSLLYLFDKYQISYTWSVVTMLTSGAFLVWMMFWMGSNRISAYSSKRVA